MTLHVHYWHEPTRERNRELFQPVTTITGWPRVYQWQWARDLHSWVSIGTMSRHCAHYHMRHLKE